jgi:hypothetical protein
MKKAAQTTARAFQRRGSGRASTLMRVLPWETRQIR